MSYSAKIGETISDVILNATGNLGNWDKILEANGFVDWTPQIQAEQKFDIPVGVSITDEQFNALKSYPVCNDSVPNIDDLIAEAFTIMDGATPITFAPIILPAKDTNTYYPVREGESIFDVVINGTGSLENLNTVLEGNSFDTWTPSLAIGQLIALPATVTHDLNTKRALAAYPISNFSVGNVDDQISAIFEILTDNWILSTGFWNDLALWKDYKNWID